jgi:hypothetical protein
MAFFPRSRKDGPDRRREDDGVRGVAFELESLEFVQAGDELGLLRVGGRWFAPVSQALGDMTLAVRRATEALELEPLPDMNGVAPVASPEGEEWYGAFPMTVEIAEDPRTEFALVAADDAEVAIPRPGEWDQLRRGEPLPDVESDSPVVAELVAKLDEVARLDDPGEPEPELTASESEPLAELRAQLDVSRVQLAAAQADLEAERRRREQLEEKVRAHLSVEEDLRNALAMQEAELSSAVAQASQRARQAERRRDTAPGREAREHPERPRLQPADDDFLARLERARRASEAAAG